MIARIEISGRARFTFDVQVDVTTTTMSPVLRCHQYYDVTTTTMSPLLRCHHHYYVTPIATLSLTPSITTPLLATMTLLTPVIMTALLIYLLLVVWGW